MMAKLKLVVATIIIGAFAGTCFFGGYLLGHKDEQMWASSAEAAAIVRVLERLESNDVASAKQELFSNLEFEIHTHWSSSRMAGIVDFPKGEAPIHVQLIEHAMLARHEFLSDPIIVEGVQKREQYPKYFPQLLAEMKEIEKHYPVGR